MSLNIDLRPSPLISHHTFSLLRKNPFPRHQRHRLWRRRRLKTAVIRSSAQFEGLYSDLISNFPSVNSLDLIAPVLGFVSGAAIYLSRYRSDGGDSAGLEVGEWVLFTSPTPFNRFVVLRCPSISIQGNELSEEVNEKLVKEDRHFVRLNSGKIHVRDDNDVAEENLMYQRVCISTDDGGVISLDWPVNLELNEEHRLDTTILLIPGNAKGSLDKNVRSLVFESLRHGVFPVVMNPRGCAGSPLTTARLFTAADSDDIATAVQFINRARPWTTIMGVGWGFGANMLTKYLAEVEDGTPLTAAVCIDNPFDLEEATKSASPHHFVLDHNLTAGLIDILQSNKELFRGRTKGFDVEKGLAANSVREFEEAISMRSYGYDAIEDFYENSSTSRIVGKVKIPLLFIQNDDGGAQLFSIPRNLIAGNPFTSLLLCSCSSSVLASGRPTISWCHHLTIEWLAAVELGLLKGRHPLLKDVDVALNPSKSLATVTSRASNKRGRVKKIVEFSQSDFLNGNGGYSLGGMVCEGDTSTGINLKNIKNPQENPESKDEGLEQGGNGLLYQKKSGDSEVVEDESRPGNDRGQVIQAAQVVMNMLDVTMPETLTEEQKKKVLSAVGQGETVIKALQDVVPDDVRGKLTNSVSEILRSEGENLKLKKFLNISQIPNVALGQKPEIQENAGFVSAGEHFNSHNPDQNNKVDTVANNSSSNEISTEIQSTGVESELQDLNPEIMANNENSSETNSKVNLKEDDNIQQSAETVSNPLTHNNKIMGPTIEEQNLSCTVSSAETQTVEKEGGENLNIEEKKVDVSIQAISTDAPIFKFSQELDALTGIDDSTQMAVNSVFGVLENMITQLEEGKDGGNKGDDKKGETKNKESLHFDKVDESSSHSKTDKDAGTRSKGYSNGRTVGSSLNPTMRNHIDGEEEKMKTRLISRNILSQHSNNSGQYYDVPLYIKSKPYDNSLFQEYIRKYLLMKMQITKSPDINTSTDLSLDYIPEEGQWKLLEHLDATHQSSSNSPLKSDINEVIEPSYVIMDSEGNHEPFLEYDTLHDEKENFILLDTTEETVSLIKEIVLDALKAEIGRRLTAANSEDMENITRDAEEVAIAVSVVAGCSKIHKLFSKSNGSKKIGTLNGDEIVNAISLAVLETSYLTKVIPLGVAVGTILTSLRIYFNIVTKNGDDQSEAMALDQIELSMRKSHGLLVMEKTDQGIYSEIDHKSDDSKSRDDKKEKIESNSINNGTAMVGAFTTALSASALLAHRKDSIENDEISGDFSKSFGEKGDFHDSNKLDEGKSPNHTVSSLAEKAMSVASPIVPMKEDGKVDQDKLVAMLAELGQRGGMLKLVSKFALLWGGMRGAMSLTDRLIQFLRIAEHPLPHRMLAFVCMVLVLWSPIVIPLLPTLVQSWGSQNTPRFSQLVCIAGLYASNMILVMLWGKRIRGYDNPLEQYGLDITSSKKVRNYFMGLIGGVLLVLSIHSVNSFLGFVSLSWPSIFLSNPVDAVVCLKGICKILLLVGQGIMTATGVALVEELLFRSWLPDEIAADFGHNFGIIISGLAFALFQRSPLAIPGLWLLSLGLSGARQRSQGSLSVPIGLRAGIMATSFVLHKGGFMIYKHNSPIGVTGSHLFQPFSDGVGLAFALLLAIFLYPGYPLHQPNNKKEIIE